MTFKKGLGLSAKIAFCVLLVIAATFATVAYLVSEHVSQQVSDDQVGAARRELQDLAGLVELWAHDSASLVALNAERLSWEPTGGADSLTIQGEYLTHFDEVLVTDKAGTVVSATAPELVGRSIAEMEIWKALADGRSASFIDPYPVKSLATQQLVIMIGAPIPRRGGVLVASVGLHTLGSALLGGRKFGATGSYSLLDDSLTIVADADANLVGGRSELSPFMQGSQASGDATYSLGGQEHYAAWVRLKALPWILSVSLPRHELLSLSQSVKADLFGGGIASLIITVGLLVFLIQLLVIRRIRALIAVLRTAATGNLTIEARVSSRDELGHIAAELDDLMESFRGLVGTMNGKMAGLTSTGAELSTNMDRTAQAMRRINVNVASTERQIAEQSKAVEETSRTVENVALTVEGLGAMIAGQAQTVTESSTEIEEMVSSIRSVSASAESARTLTGELLHVSGEGKKRLGAVMKEIDRIARQSTDLQAAAKLIAAVAANTNLLAMNASIEAAHAGEWGKGFGVVADEIRILAEQASRQSRDISKRLVAIKSGIDEVAKTSVATGQAFGVVFETVEKVGGIVSQIERAMAEQNDGSRQILDGLRNINDVTVQVKEGSEQMREGSGQILAAIAHLKEANSAAQSDVARIASGSREADRAVANVVALTTSTRESIDAVRAAAARFTVSEA